MTYKEDLFIEQSLTNEDDTKEEKCLIKAYFDREQKKPSSQRKNHCMIYCSCSRCSPGKL